MTPSTSSAHVTASQSSVPAHCATDDEILGLASASSTAKKSPRKSSSPVNGDAQAAESSVARTADDVAADDPVAAALAAKIAQEPEALRELLDKNPELRQAWHSEKAFREIFPTVEHAQSARDRAAELAQLDALFFSGQPGDHAELAAEVYRLNPAAFRSLVHAMSATLARMDGKSPAESRSDASHKHADIPGSAADSSAASAEQGNPSPQQTPSQNSDASLAASNPESANRFAAFYHDANAAVVHSVVNEIRGQVERLLPEGITAAAQNRVIGEIYRELDASLRSNRALAQQLRQAFRSGAMDADHQAAIVGLILGRAKQMLPGVAKRVLNEWTTGVLAAADRKSARQRAAESRADITGGAPGSSFKRSMAPGDLDYKKLSDADILNL